MTKVNGNNNVSAEYKIVNGKKVKKQEQSKNQKQVFNNKGQKTPQKPNDSAIKQEVYKKSGYQLKDTKDRNKIIQLKVNGKIRSYKTVGTLTTGGRILVKERGKEVYHVVSHTKDNKLVMLKDDYAKNKIFYESTSSEHKVKYGKKNYVITNSKRDRHGRMSAIDENGKRVVLSTDGKELKTGYVEAEDQKDNMNDYIAKQTKGKSKAEADKIRQQILSGNSSYSNKGVLRFKASNGEVWYYDTKRKTYVKYAEKEAQAIIKNLDKGATENWLLFRTGLGTDYELLKNTNAQIIDPEVLNKVNKHYSAEYGNKVDKNAQYGSGKYKTAYEAFLASEIGDDEVYQFNAALVKNNAITDQSRRNEILQTNLTKIKSNGLGVSGRANRLAAADAASTKEDYQALQDAAEEELKKTNYKAPFKGSDALQTYIYGVNNGDVQEIDDFNTTLIDPKEDMIDRDEIVKIKAETGVLWAKKGKYDKAFESQDSEVVDKMFALQDANGKASLNVKELKAKAKGFQGEYLMFAKPELFTEQELADKAVSMLTVALDQFDFIEKQNSLQSESVLHNLSHSRSDVVASAMSDNGTKNASKNAIEASISKAYTLIRNDKVLNLVKQKMGDKFNLLQKKEQAMFKTNTFANVTTKNDNVKSNLSAEEVAQNKYVVSWLKNQLEDLERDKKMNEAKEGWKQTAVDAMRTSLRAGETRESLANKYDLIKSNMSRLEAAAEGKLVDASGKPVSFEDAMKNLGETGIQALEHANADYQTAQQTGEFMVDMAVLALPLPKGFNAANTVIKMGNALYKVISKSDKACKVIKITQEAAKGSKIYEVVTNVATKNPKLVENARKVATIMDSSATGAMHMAGKTVALDASNIATSREGFTSDRISEMNTKTQSAAVFGGMGGAIGGTTAVASEFVSSAGAKYAVHGVGLVADLMGAAGLMTAESHGETNFWDNLRCVNPDGSFNFEQASMTAMMIFGHLHGMSAVRGKVKPHVELQADGTFKAKLGDNVLTLNKDGIWSDSASGREFRLAENKNGKAELTELTKKEVAARHSEASAEESRGTSTQQIKSFKERINNAKTREELNAIRDDIKKTDLTVQERNELMTESLKVQREWGQAPERRQIVNMATEGEASVMGKPELTALRQEVGIKQSKPGLHFEGETNGENTVINEMKGNDTVNSYIVSRDVEGKAHIEYKVSYENGKATDVEIYNADGTIKKLPAETKQAVLEELNKPAETDPVSHSEAPVEESRVNSESHSEAIAEESQAKAKTESEKPATEKPATEEHKPVAESKGEGEKPVESNKPAETDPVSHSERSEESQAKETPATEERKPVVAKEAQVKTETDKIEYVRDENGNVIKEIHKGDNLTREILKDAEGNVLESIENVYDSQGKLQKTIHKDAKGYTVAIYDNVNKRMVFDIREKSVNNNAQADSKPESHKHAESLPENWEIPENNMTTFRRNKNAVTDIKNINPEDISVDGNYTGYTHFSGPSEKSLGVNGDIRTFVLQQTDIGVAYDKAKNITIITTKINDAYNRPGIISIKVKGQVSEADGIALVKNLEKANAIPKTTSNIELSQELDVIGRRIQQETAKFFNEKQTNSARDIKAPVEESSVKPESHSERSEESQVAPKTEERKPVVENKGEGDKPVVEPQAKEPAEKPATENSVIASESEAIQSKQKTEGKTPVTSQEQSTGKTPEEAAAIHNSEVETAGVTPVQQTKAQQLELERLQTLVQSKEGQVILADAMKDPNFGKPLSERVPDEGFKMTEDGRSQIEVDGVVYTQQNKGDFRLVSSDGKILEDCFGEEPKNPSATDNPNLTRLYRNGDGKIFGIENQYGAIDYSHTSPEYYPAGKPNTSWNLSLGRPTENYIMTDNVGRVMFNGTETRSSNYFTKTKNGSTTSDSNIVSDLNQAIQDVNLKNTTFSTKKGRQKAYEDVRTQIDNAYNENKLTGKDYDNLVTSLNSKAEKSGGLIVRETHNQQIEAIKSKRYETIRDHLSDKIDKVATQSDYDNMVAEINEAFKSGKIDSNAASILNKTLDAKGELIEGVETLSQKKAKIETQVREIETAQRIEEVEANSQHRAELLDEYLAEFGENLPSEIGTKEYYDEALSTIDRGVKSGLIEPQKAEVLRTQAKEQLAKLELESSQPATENPVNANEGKSETKAPETDSARHSELDSESKQPATGEPVVAKEAQVKTEGKTEQTPVNANEGKSETKALETDSARHSELDSESNQQVADKPVDEKSQVKIEQENNKEFSTSDIPVELSEMEEYVKNSNVVEFPENENTYTYSIKNDKTGKLMYVRFNNKNSKRSSITIVEANKQEQHIEFTKDGENPTKVTYKDADGNIIKYAEYEYNENNQITKGTERNADGSLKGSSEYEYDGNDKLVKLTNKDADGKVIESRELKYNDAGKLTEQIEKDADGKITGVFDGDGNPLKFSTEETPVTNGQKTAVGEEPQNAPKTEEKTAGESADVENETPKFEEVETNEGLQLRHKVGDENSYEFFNPKTLKWEPTTKQFFDERVARDGVKAKPAEQPVTKKSLEDAIEKIKTQEDAEEYIAEHNEAKDNGKITEEEYADFVEKAGEKLKAAEAAQNNAGEVAEANNNEKQPVTEPENTPDGFPKTPSKPKQLEKKTLEEILGDEKAPKTTDEAKEYAEAHEDAEFVIDDDPNYCDILYLDNEQNNMVFYNKDGSINGYKVITRATNGDVKAEQYDADGNLIEKQLYSNENNVWTVHEVYFDPEGNMTGAKKSVQNNETWEQTAEYEYNADKNRFEQKNEKDEVVSTVKYDEATEHWAEYDAEGNIIHEINKPETVDNPTPAQESQGVIENESSTGESTPVSENSETADTKPSKISMFDKLFHRNKARLEKEVASGEKTIGDYKFNTVKDENGYVRTKTDNKNVVRQKEYFNAKGKKIKTETFDTNKNLIELTEGNVTTEYYADGDVKRVKYPNNKTVEFIYENGELTGAEYTEEISKAREFARSITAEENEFGEYEYDTIKRRTNYTYNSDKGHFELSDENGKVVTDKNGKPVGTATFDPETRHWVEDGQYSSDLAPKTTNVSRGEGRFRIKLPERNKVPKNLRDENGKLREGVKPFNDGYTETISKEGVEITKAYDSKGTLLLEASKEKATYYNAKGEVIAEEKPIPNGVQRTEFSKDYELDVLFNSQGDAEKITIKYHKDKKGNIAKPEEFIYDKENKVYKSNDKDKDGKAVKTLDYDAKNHSWTIRDGEGKKLDSQNNMKESHIKRNLGIGAGVLVVGGVALYGVSKLTKSDDDKDVEQPDNPAIAEQVAKTIAKQAANAKAETKVTLDGKEGTIAEDGTLTLDGKKYPKDTDGTYAIGDKKYKVEDGKLVEVVDTPDDNGETGGAAPDESPEVKGTIDGKEYTINSDGSATIGGHMYEKESDGYYHTEDGSIYGIGEDGKLVKIDKTQTGSDGSQAGSAGNATQTGSDSAQSGNTGATSQQTGNTNTTGNNTHVTAPAQPADSSASTRTTGTTHNDTSVTTRHTNVPAEESRANSTRPSEQSEESRHTGNTPVTGVTEPTQEQKQVAKTLQDEISSISTQADVKAFFAKAISAYNAGKITLMQLDVLKTQVENYVETLNEAIKIQNEQDAIQKPEFGLGEVTTPQEPQRKEKRDITPVERMDLTESIRKAKNREDIAKIQQKMRQYKVFQGRKNLRRAYKAKLRAIKHQDEPQKVKKYNDKFEKRMDKIEDSKVYKNDENQINRENFQKMKYFDDIIKRPKDFDDGIFNA